MLHLKFSGKNYFICPCHCAWQLFFSFTFLCHWALVGFTLPQPLHAADCTTSLNALSAAMNHYNVITLEDLSTTAQIEGRTFVGDDLVSRTSATFASGFRRLDSADSTLVVVDEIVGGNPLNLNAGAAVVGGDHNGRIINFNGGGSLTQNGALSNQELTTVLTEGSAYLATLPANNVPTIPLDRPGPVRFTVDDVQSTEPAIFHIDGVDLFENPNVQQIELLPHRAETIVINVAGTTIDWRFGNMIGNLVNQNWRENIIWNFYEATTIQLNGNNFMGALLAPYADVTTAGRIDGSVAVRSLTTTAAVNQPEYQGKPAVACSQIPTPVPTLTQTSTPTLTPTLTPTPTPSPLPAADLTVQKYAMPNPVIAGEPLLYTIIVHNHGPQEAETITVTDQLPPGVTFRSAGPTCSFQASTVTCHVAQLAVDEQALITIVVDVDATADQ